MAPPKMLDALLDAGSSDSSDDEEGAGSGASPSHDAATGGEDDAGETKRQKKGVTLEDLQRAGYRSGPSVLTMKTPKEDEPEQNYAWSDGRQARAQQEEETLEDRLATQHAASVGAETTAKFAQASVIQAERMREQRRAEREAQVAERKAMSFNQKEKRKRDEGKQARGKSYVEEEKRLQRQFGMYSGFDT